MASMNRVFLVGNLTRDPEVKQTPSGTPVAELRLAVSETYRDAQTNQPKEIVCYVDVAVWGRQAELCQQYLSKGRPVLVEGRLRYDEWKTPQGEMRSKLRVRADRVQFLGAPRREGEAAPAAHAAAPAAGAPPAAVPPAMMPEPAEPAAAESGDADDLPF